MADKEYIERVALIEHIKNMPWKITPAAEISKGIFLQTVEEAPAADVVSKGVYEQVQWERDMAMKQLEEHGIPFGGEADDVVNVVRCKDCKYTEMIVDIIGNPQLYCRHHRYYPNVDFDDFCSWGKRKEKDDVR